MDIRDLLPTSPTLIRAVEYTPGISTLSSIVQIALFALKGMQNTFTGIISHKYKKILYSHIARQCILIVPVLGNIAIALSDHIAHSKQKSPHLNDLLLHSVPTQQRLEALEKCESLKNNKNLTEKELKNTIQSIQALDAELLADEDVMLEMAMQHPQILQFSPLNNNREFILEVCKTNQKILKHVGDTLKNDPKFWLEVLQKYYSSLSKQDYDDTLNKWPWENTEFCLQALTLAWEKTRLKYDKNLWKNKEFVLSILQKDPGEVGHIADDLWKDPDFCLQALPLSAETAQKIADHIPPEEAKKEVFWLPFLALADLTSFDINRLMPLLDKIPDTLRKQESFMLYVAEQVPGAEALASQELQQLGSFQQRMKELYLLRSKKS